MKKAIGKILMIVCLLISTIFNVSIVSAETVNDENLRVRTEVTKLEDNKVSIKLRLTNLGIGEIKDINVENILPDDLKLKKGDSTTKKIEVLAAGEAVNWQIEGEIKEYSILGIEFKNQAQYIGVLIIIAIVLILGLVVIFRFISKKRKSNTFNKTFSTLLAIVLTASILQVDKIVQASENTTKEVIIKDEIEIDDKTYVIETIVKYKENVLTQEAGGEVLSREEWIGKLVNTLELKVDATDDGEELETDFNDIEDSEYKELIIIAEEYSIISDEEEFKPKEVATREFAAVTTINAFGIEGTENINCDDSNEIENHKAVEKIIAMNLMKLEENKFYPKRELTENEGNYIISSLHAISKNNTIDKEYENSIGYNKEIIIIDSDIEYSKDGSVLSLELNKQTEKIKENDIFILNNEEAFKVESIVKEEQWVIINTIKPELEEVVEYIDVQGIGIVDTENIILEDGVTIEVIDHAGARARNTTVDSNEREFRITYNKKFNNGTKMDLEGEILIGEIQYRIDVDLGRSRINNMYVSMENDLRFQGHIESAEKSGYVKLAKIPIAGVVGVSLSLEIGAKYSASGQVDLLLSISPQAKVGIYNEELIFDASLEPQAELSLEGDASLGVPLKLAIDILKIEFANVGIEAGVKVNANAISRYIVDMKCLDISTSAYGKVDAFKDSFIGNKFNMNLETDLIDSQLGSYHSEKHSNLEGYEKVESCTYVEAGIQGKITESNGSGISNATIKIYNNDGTLIEELKTGSDGSYKVIVEPGKYKVEITKDGYDLKSYEVNLNSGEYKNTTTELKNNRVEENSGSTGGIGGTGSAGGTGGQPGVSNGQLTADEAYDSVWHASGSGVGVLRDTAKLVTINGRKCWKFAVGGYDSRDIYSYIYVDINTKEYNTAINEDILDSVWEEEWLRNWN